MNQHLEFKKAAVCAHSVQGNSSGALISYTISNASAETITSASQSVLGTQHLVVFPQEALLVHAMPEQTVGYTNYLEVTSYPHFTAENTSQHPTQDGSINLVEPLGVVRKSGTT